MKPDPQPSVPKFTQAQLDVLMGANLIRPSGRSADGRVTSYELTGAGRILLDAQLRLDKI